MSRIDPAPPPRARSASRPTPADELRRKAAARLAEKVDFARSRHKPLSLLRTEARRVVEQFLEVEAAALPKADRDRLVEEILADTVGLGPLEELFRDDAVGEFMVLAHNQIIARKGAVWLPTSVSFRDPGQYRHTLTKMAQQGEAVAPPDGEKPAGADPAAIDVRLANGFRVVAVLPPAVLDQSPLAVFTRGTPAPLPPALGSKADLQLPPAPRGDVLRSPAPGRTTLSDSPATARPGVASGAVTTPPPRPTSPAPVQGSGAMSAPPPRPSVGSASRPADPLDRLRQRITERLVTRLAAAGVYDVSQVPVNELRRVIAMYVEEFSTAERLGLDGTTQDRLTLEILSGVKR